MSIPNPLKTTELTLSRVISLRRVRYSTSGSIEIVQADRGTARPA